MSLQQNQRSAVARMINLNNDITSSGNKNNTWSDKWKVLVYDKASRSTIAPLLSVQDLRQLGITVYMIAKSKREKIPDVPAVYFLKPTPENVAIVANDCNQGLYQAAHINFSSTLPRALLEKLAEETSKGGGSQRVARLMDQYLDFVALEPCLFTLERPLTYYNYARDGTNDLEVRTCMTSIVDGLFSTIVTLGMVPIIRAPSNGPAELVAKQLDEKLRKAMRNSKTQHLFQNDTNKSSKVNGSNSNNTNGTGEGILRDRPVLVILDRGLDLGQVMHHTSLYQPLVDDLLSFQLNRVTFSKKETSTTAHDASSAASETSFTLDPNIDPFWNEFGGQLFPNAVEGNERDRARLAREEQDISNSGQTGDMSNIANAVASLERHTDNKKRMNDHLNLLEATMNVIVSRALPEYYECEENIVSGNYLQTADHTKYFELLGNPSKGTYYDKLRMAVVWIQQDVNMCTERMDVYNNITTILNEAALSENKNNTIHVTILKHVQDVLRMNNGKNGSSQQQQVNTTTSSTSKDSGWSLRGLTQGIGAVVAKAKEWIPRAAPDTKITQVAGGIMSGKESNYLYFDSKIGTKSGESLPNESRRKGSYNSGIVFVVGGATYTEYHNMKEWAKKQKPQPKNVLIGSTSMLNAETFIDELARFSPSYVTGTVD